MDFKILAYDFLLKADKGCHWVLARHIINNAVSLHSERVPKQYSWGTIARNADFTSHCDGENKWKLIC